MPVVLALGSSEALPGPGLQGSSQGMANLYEMFWRVQRAPQDLIPEDAVSAPRNDDHSV